MRVDAALAQVLSFPQWQGFGEPRAYAAGNTLLGRLLQPLPIQSVACTDHPVLRLIDGALGLDVLQQQIAAAGALLQGMAGPILTVGGDCSADLASIALANARHDGEIALIWLDAHADINTPQTSPSAHVHGMVVRILCGEGNAELTGLVARPLRPDQIFYVGARDLDPGEVAFIDQHAIRRFSVDVLRREGPQAVTAVVRQAGFTKVYIHLDLDVLDPDIFPWVNVPVMRGLTLAEVVAAVAALREQFSVVGAAITECSVAQPDWPAARTLLLPILQQGLGLPVGSAA